MTTPTRVTSGTMPRDWHLPRYDSQGNEYPYAARARRIRTFGSIARSAAAGSAVAAATWTAKEGYRYISQYLTQESSSSPKITWDDSKETLPVFDGIAPAPINSQSTSHSSNTLVLPTLDTPPRSPNKPWWTLANSGSPPGVRSFQLTPPAPIGRNSQAFSQSQYAYTPSSQKSTQSRLVRRWRRRSQGSQLRHLHYLKRFVSNQKLRFLLRSRARSRRPRHYLSTSVRQASRRLLHSRKKYIFVRPSQRRKARLLVASNKKALWKARRRFRNAPFSQKAFH